MTALASQPLVQLQRPTHATDQARRTSVRMVDCTIDGQPVSVREGTTIFGACREIGIQIPTLCYLDTLHPVNACRVCVVELEGARVLVPSCSRAVDQGMVIHTNSPRVQHSRKLVLEMLASSVDLSTTPDVADWIDAYGAQPERFGPPAPPAPAGRRDASIAGHHAPPNPEYAATVAEPTKIDNDLYVRDYAKCILCYKCVEACGPDHQNTFAIAVAGRGFDAHISTEFAVPLPESACVYCGNCIAVCPTGALMAKTEFDKRAAGDWNPSRMTTTDTICPYCGVGCTLRLHVDEGEIVKAMSPLENPITQGNLCIKGRFGWRFVGNRSASTADGDNHRDSDSDRGNGRH
jgi:predicted molibdopterin-dependent oxidoreductase YjgC